MSKGSILPSLLLVLFVGLKLSGVIDWSWWWVLSPIWVTGILAFIILILYYFIYKKYGISN